MVDSLLRPLLLSDVAEFAAQVARLAGFGLAGITDGDFTALVRVEMSASASAVAIGRHRLLVDVVHERTALGRKTRDRDSELDTSAILSGYSSDRATNSVLGLLRQCSNIRCTLGVVANYGSSDNGRGLGGDSRSRSDEREDLNAHVESDC
jgi:hypothetical protein